MRNAGWGVLVAVLLLAVTSATARAEEPASTGAVLWSAGGHTFSVGPAAEVQRVDWGIAGPAIGAFAGAYLTNVVGSALAGYQCVWTAWFHSDCAFQSDWLAFRLVGAVPVAGPFIQLGLEPGTAGGDAWAPFLIANGITQTFALTFLLVELLHPSRRVSLTSGAVEVRPELGAQRAGLSLIGTF